jgi:hypothetical protein
MEGNDFRLVQLKQMLAMGHDFPRILHMDEFTTGAYEYKYITVCSLCMQPLFAEILHGQEPDKSDKENGR